MLLFIVLYHVNLWPISEILNSFVYAKLTTFFVLVPKKVINLLFKLKAVRDTIESKNFTDLGFAQIVWNYCDNHLIQTNTVIYPPKCQTTLADLNFHFPRNLYTGLGETIVLIQRYRLNYVCSWLFARNLQIISISNSYWNRQRIHFRIQ